MREFISDRLPFLLAAVPVFIGFAAIVFLVMWESRDRESDEEMPNSCGLDYVNDKTKREWHQSAWKWLNYLKGVNNEQDEVPTDNMDAMDVPDDVSEKRDRVEK